jgi:hypothetical protein
MTALQNAYGNDIDRRFGTKRAHTVRLIGAASLSVLVVIGYFGALLYNPALKSSMYLIGPVLVVIGVAASITWGTVTQVTSCLPPRYQTLVSCIPSLHSCSSCDHSIV